VPQRLVAFQESSIQLGVLRIGSWDELLLPGGERLSSKLVFLTRLLFVFFDSFFLFWTLFVSGLCSPNDAVIHTLGKEFA
jgi:hypothetical protein